MDIMTQLTCCVFVLLHAPWLHMLFIPQAVQLLSDWCWWWGKKSSSALQTYFWLQRKSNPVC